MQEDSRYYLVERVVEKALMDMAGIALQERMSGFQRNPDIVLLAKRDKKTLYPLHFYTHVDDIHRSPIKNRITAYGYTPVSLEALTQLRDVGCTRLVLWSQYFRDVPSPRRLSYDPQAWYDRYGLFREYAKQCGIELYILRLSLRSHFLAPLHEGITSNNQMILMATKKLELDSMVEQDINFSRKRWAVTHPDYLADHVRQEQIKLFQLSDMEHVRGYVESALGPLLVVKTTILQSLKGSHSWDMLRERAPLLKKARDSYVLHQ